LEGALQDYDGTILTVSHDRYFINRVANRIIEMTPEGVTAYEGNYDDYVEKKKRMQELLSNVDTAGKTRTQLDKEQRRERINRDELRQRKVRFRQLEQDIDAGEKQMGELEAVMADGTIWLDREQGLKKQAELDALKLRLEEMYAQWEELAEQLHDEEGK
ncbi:MAG: thiamine ABC transporter substrate-binding protein, partial [Clostridia bacterium]|nr:thiamine ABC transporter substrate-binding protein [Clostridia bacterium]